MKKLGIAISIIVIASSFAFHANANTKVKVALILDTSNSMDGLIDQAKSQLWNVVNELSKAQCDGESSDLEIALYEYGNDKLPMREGYIRLVTPFTSDLDLFSDKLFKLKTLGGSEYCGQVIGVSLRQLEWGNANKDLRMIFIAGNEPFDQGNVSYREVCKTARESDIIVNTIFCGDFQEGVSTFWKDGAYIGGGDFMNIDQDCKYVHIPTPYDDKIMKLNEQLNDTYVAYGSKGTYYKNRQEEQDNNARSASEASALKRTATKSGKAYSNKSWDLVDAYEQNEEIIIELDNEDLPSEMKDMNKDERIAFVEEKQQERNSIQREISELNIKRDKFITENQEQDDPELLDKAIIKAVKKQAIAKNYHFDDN